ITRNSGGAVAGLVTWKVTRPSGAARCSVVTLNSRSVTFTVESERLSLQERDASAAPPSATTDIVKARGLNRLLIASAVGMHEDAGPRTRARGLAGRRTGVRSDGVVRRRGARAEIAEASDLPAGARGAPRNCYAGAPSVRGGTNAKTPPGITTSASGTRNSRDSAITLAGRCASTPTGSTTSANARTTGGHARQARAANSGKRPAVAIRRAHEWKRRRFSTATARPGGCPCA